jgi:hypothetical protein
VHPSSCALPSPHLTEAWKRKNIKL